jgi:hypothetical protein
MDYFVSGHGGLPSGGATTPVPAGFNFVLFCNRGSILPDDQAWPIYNHLMAGDTTWANARIVQRFFEGASMPNYLCWNYPEIAQASGVFKVGAMSPTAPGQPVVSLAPYTAAAPLSVSALFGLLPAPAPGTTTTVYWVACAS